MSVQIGAIEGLIRLRDEFSGPLNRTSSQLDRFGRSADDIGNRVSRMGDRVGKALAFGAVLAGVGAAVRSVYQNVAEAQRAMAQLEAGVRSTGGAAGYSAEQLAEMATRFQRLTAVEDEQIMAAQGILLTFRNIGHDAFPRALQAALNLSARGFGPLETTMKMVGKAAEMPKTGITALSRAGVQFTEAQKKTIEVMVDTGRIAEAQGLIFDELTAQVGGSAEALRNTLPGAVAALSNAWGDLLEQVGQSADGGGLFMTGINGMVSALEWLKDNWVAVEVAVFETLGDIGSGLTQSVTTWIGLIELFARAAKAINPTAWFGPGEKATDRFIDNVTSARKSVQQLGDDLKSGFQQKAADALNAAYEPAKKLKGALGSPGGVAGAAGEATDKARKLAADLASLRAELQRSTETNRKLAAVWRSGGIDPKRTEEQARAIERTAKLHEQYLRDVDKYGRIAASALLADRAAAESAAEGARIAEEAYRGLIDALSSLPEIKVGEYLDDVRKQIEAGARKMREDAQRIISGLAFEKELSQEVEFQVRLSGVEEFGGQLAEVEASYLQFLRNLGEGSVDQGEQVVAEIESRFAGFIERIYGHLQKLSDVQIGRDIRGASDTPVDVYRRERAEIEDYLSRSVDRTSKAWRDGMAYIARITEDHWSSQLDGWVSLFSFIGDRMGGAIQQIARALSNIQSAYQQGKQLDASGFGSSMGMSGSWGYALATIQIMYEIYKAVDAMIERHKARKWSEMTSVSVTGGDWSSPSYFEQNGREFSEALRGVIQSITDVLGGFLLDLPKISIKARKDGKEFSAYVAGVFVGTFADAQSAMEAGVATAIQQARFEGLSREFVLALQNSIGASMDELRANIETAQFARRSRIGDVGSQYLDLSDRYRQEIEAQRRLGLAIADTIDARHRELDALKNNVLGIDTAVSDQLRAIRSLNTGMEEAAAGMRAQLEASIRLAQEQLARLRQDALRPGHGGQEGQGGSGGGRGSGGGGRVLEVSSFDPAIADLQAQIDRWLAELGRVPQGLSEMEIRMGVFDALFRHIEQNQALSRKYEEDRVKYAKFKVELEFIAIRQQLVLMGRFEEFAAMFDDAYRAAMEAAGRAPGGRGSGSGSGSSRDSVRDFITGREWELAARSMGEFERAVAETRRQYEEQIEQAGRDAGLRAQLIALRERELALMAEERRARTTTDFRQFLGLGNQFDAVRETAAGLIKQIQDSPYGDARKARMIGRVMDELELKLDRLAKESARDLLSGLIGDLETFGASEILLAETRRHMAALEHTLKMENYRVEIEILRAQGRLAPAIMTAIDNAFTFLQGIDPTSLFTGQTPAANDNEPGWAWRQGPGGYYLGPRGGEGDGAGSEIDGFADALKRATELLARYRTDGLDPLRRRLIEITGDFRTIRSAMGDTADVMRAMAGAVRSALDEFLEPVRSARRDLFFGQSSSADALSQWARVQAEFADMQTRFRAGDLSVVEGIDSFSRQFLDLARLVSPVGSEGFRFWERALDTFLGELERVDVADLGTVGNPMTVDGIGDLALLSEAQLDALNRLYESNERVVAALEQQAVNSSWSSAHALVA